MTTTVATAIAITRDRAAASRGVAEALGSSSGSALGRRAASSMGLAGAEASSRNSMLGPEISIVGLETSDAAAKADGFGSAGGEAAGA